MLRFPLALCLEHHLYSAGSYHSFLTAVIAREQLRNCSKFSTAGFSCQQNSQASQGSKTLSGHALPCPLSLPPPPALACSSVTQAPGWCCQEKPPSSPHSGTWASRLAGARACVLKGQQQAQKWLTSCVRAGPGFAPAATSAVTRVRRRGNSVSAFGLSVDGHHCFCWAQSREVSYSAELTIFFSLHNWLLFSILPSDYSQSLNLSLRNIRS